MEVVDPYEKLRGLLPGGSKLAFVFENLGDGRVKEGNVFYFQNYLKAKNKVYYISLQDGALIDPQGAAGMDDDGLDKISPYSDDYGKLVKEKAERETRAKKLLADQFRGFTAIDDLNYQNVSGLDTTESGYKHLHVARGVDVVLVRSYQQDAYEVFGRQEWDLSDEIISLLKTFPPLVRTRESENYKPNADGTEYRQFEVGNCETLLPRIIELFEDAPRSESGKRVVMTTWQALQQNLEIAQYHPDLAPLYTKMVKTTETYLMKDFLK